MANGSGGFVQTTTAGTSADIKKDKKHGAAPSLVITHIASNKFVTFNHMKMRAFKDDFKTSYNSEQVFGRMDPIVTYQGTTRNITLGFDIGTHGDDAMAKSLAMATRLMQFQYPVYEDPGNALSLSRPPLVYVEFGNYIRSGAGGPLLCAMQGFTYSPFDKHDRTYSPMIRKVNGTGEPHLIPKRISFDMNFIVLHEQTPGWGDAGQGEIDWIGGDKYGKIDFDAYYNKSTKKVVGGATTNADGSTVAAITAGMSQSEIKDQFPNTLPQAEIDKILASINAN
jgi:hypothetical protein